MGTSTLIKGLWDRYIKGELNRKQYFSKIQAVSARINHRPKPANPGPGEAIDIDDVFDVIKSG